VTEKQTRVREGREDELHALTQRQVTLGGGKRAEDEDEEDEDEDEDEDNDEAAAEEDEESDAEDDALDDAESRG
jgi:hypothetical protein